jgi:hypothetical protein
MNLCRISGGGARWWSYRKWSRAREHAQPEVTPVTWPEVTEVCSVHSRLFPAFFLTIVVVQSVVQQYKYQDYRKWPKVNIRPSGAFSSQVTSSNVTSKGVPLGELCSCANKRCAHAQPRVAQYPPYCRLFTGNDVIKRHVTPSGFLGRVMRAHAQPTFAQYPIKRHP